MICSLNPFTGELQSTHTPHTPSEIEVALAKAASAQAIWRRTPVSERIIPLRTLANLLRAEIDEIAKLATLEMGKPITEALAEVEKCALNCDFYTNAAPQLLADTTVHGIQGASIVHDPLGLVLAIMPWNYPLWQVVRFAVPALASGNGVVLKHAGNVPQCALALQSLFIRAGVPDGLFVNIFAEPAQASKILADSRIAAVTLTGSTQVGMTVAAQAAGLLKKQVLELGGSDPFIVLDDADISLAAQQAVIARFTNTGQSCVNAKRFILAPAIANDFVDAFCFEAKRLVQGDPFDNDTRLGPMARNNLRVELHSQVERSVESGAVLVTGGRMPEGAAFAYPATILDGVRPGMAAFDQETFGPVAAMIRADGLDDAIALANRTEFGLGASIWTADLDLGARVARDMDAGAVSINAIVSSDPRLPFGGIKHSGYGRELGEAGLKEFTNMKTVRISAS